ncbi:MAG: DNA polymerase I [Alphaproteobacteria bacterium 41-28]|nr:MAG: DNA polymerase I [Alphaproteobacteria bacterium 41-28]
MSHKPPQIYLVDGSGYIFRAFHALPPLTRPDGTQIGAVLGFTNMLIKLLREKNPDYLVVIFDAARENFRNQIYPAYKANRQETPPELIPQFSLIRDACDAFDVPHIEKEGYEADDLIATYAHSQPGDVTIVSSDKDLMQLVGGSVKMLDPIKNRMIGVEEVIEKFGVPPEKVADIQALAGDPTDNVPGVPGIGIKTASELIQTYGTLENLLEHASEIKQPKRREALIEHAENARISKELVKLKDDVPGAEPLEMFAVKPFRPEKAFAFLKEQSFNALIHRLEKEGPAVPQEKATYELIQDTEALKKWTDRIHRLGFMAFDTETTSLDAMEAQLVGVCLATDVSQACYIPVGHQGEARDLLNPGTTPKQIPLKEALALLKPLLENPAILKIAQNMKYDALVLKKYGIDVAPVDDTMVISYVLEGTQHGHGMDELAKLHLDYDTIKYQDVVGSGRSQVTFDKVPLDKALAYAAEDADITYQLYSHLKPRLLTAHQCTVYETLERPLIPVLVDMEYRGIKVDPFVLKRLSGEFAKRLEDIEKSIQEEVDQPFNVASPKQLGEILFEKLKLPGGKKGKTGAYGTAADVLESLSEQGFKIADKLLEWRQLAKLKSTYTETLINQINPKTGRVHTSYAMTGTSTGRLSSSDPNLQNIPTRSEEGKKIRSAFLASPGMKLLSVDYSQIELRLLAHMADLPELKKAFKEGKDIHAETASLVFGVPLSEITPELRYRAKAINFGIIYGISPFGLARQLGISRESAAQYIQTYFSIYPGIQAYVERMKQDAREKGYVTTLLGRHCFIQDIHSNDPTRRNFAERQAINAPLQGGNADIIKKAMVKLDRLFKEKHLDAHMLLQVHDELIFEIAEGDLPKAKPLIVATMQGIVSLSVPLVVETNVGNTWAEV